MQALRPPWDEWGRASNQALILPMRTYRYSSWPCCTRAARWAVVFFMISSSAGCPIGPYILAEVVGTQVFFESKVRLQSLEDHDDLRHRDSNSALLTTLTLDSAMASPAQTGLSNPKAASGMPITL